MDIGPKSILGKDCYQASDRQVNWPRGAITRKREILKMGGGANRFADPHATKR